MTASSKKVSYKTLDAPYEPNQIREFFAFGCGACYLLEKDLKAWQAKLPKKVAFKRTPLVFQKSWREQSRAYYIAKKLGVEKAFTEKLFKAIHEEGKSNHLRDDLKNLLAQSGAPKNKLESAFKSMLLDIELKRDEAFMIKHRLFALPVFVVHGKYLVTLDDTDEASGQSFFSIMDELIKHPPKNG